MFFEQNTNIRKKAQVLSSRVQSVASKRDDPTKKSGTGGFDVKSGHLKPGKFVSPPTQPSDCRCTGHKTCRRQIASDRSVSSQGTLTIDHNGLTTGHHNGVKWGVVESV